MKRRIFVIFIIIVLAACSAQRQEVSLHNFDWNVIGDIAPFSFNLENATAKTIDVSVFVVAESKTESRNGTLSGDVGNERIEIMLSPKEIKKVTGQIHLLSSRNIALQAFITIKNPI